ncbi:MAG TPA: hypothetical protein VF089_19660 [Candidatus Binatia bacterium]
MLAEKRGDAAAPEIADWANRVARRIDEQVAVGVDYDGDSNTFLLRLTKGSRVLLFRLSESQVHVSGREAECERTLQRKIKDLWNLI